MLRYTHLLKAHFYYHNQVYKFVYGCVSLDRNHRTVDDNPLVENNLNNI
jgi:hypothetical protein